MRRWKHGFGILALMLWGAWTGCEILGTHPGDPPFAPARIVPPDVPFIKERPAAAISRALRTASCALVVNFCRFIVCMDGVLVAR